MGEVGGGNVRARSRSVRTRPPRWCRGLPPTSLQGRLSPPAFVAGSAAWSLSPPSPPASACRAPVRSSRPGCANGRHPSCRLTQPLHSDPDAGAPGGLWRFPARAAHERQLWTDPRRACGGSGARSAHSRLLGGPQSWLRGTDFQRLSRGQHLSAPRLPLVPVQKRGAHGAFVESLFAVSAQVS